MSVARILSQSEIVKQQSESSREKVNQVPILQESQVQDPPHLKVLKQRGEQYVREKILSKKITQTKRGSLKHLLFGTQPSFQSVSIKMGLCGEPMTKDLIDWSDKTLMDCGLQQIGNKKIDVDLLWSDPRNKTIYYRELKGNIEMDTEKIPAMLEKIKTVTRHYTKEYPGFTVNSGVLVWLSLIHI